MAKKTSRDDDISSRPAIAKKLLDVFRDVEKGYADQRERSDNNLDYWDAYNCILGPRQFYAGNSKVYVPIIRNAVDARCTRFSNQLFPKVGRYVDVTTENGDIPHATMSLLEHYVEKAKARTQVVPALIRNGDIEGQMTICIDWQTVERHTVTRVKKPIKIDGIEMPELDEIDAIEEETIEEGRPGVEVIADADFLVLPATVDSLEEALEDGGSVTIIRRWSKAKIKGMMAAGHITAKGGDTLLKAMSSKRDAPGRKDMGKELADAAGIKAQTSGKIALVYETWTKLKVDGDMRLTKAFYGGEDQILGCKLNPNWSDRPGVVSAPVKKLAGVFKGQSMIQPGVLDMQIAANDAVNEGMDSAAYALMPIIMTNPESNPRVGSMVLDLAAVWEVNPNETKFATFPALWKEAFEIVASCKTEIFQSLSVNPAMMPQQTGKRGGKLSQAEIANEQQVDILTTADAVTNIEGEILTPMLQHFAELDHQYRDDDIIVRSFGEMGQRAIMEEIPPIQMSRRYRFVWAGVEAARNAAQVQQMISGLNVLKGVPPEMLNGYRIDAVPMIEHFVNSTFGPRLGALTFVSLRDQLSVPPETENDMLAQGLPVQVHPMDQDPQHLQVHMQLLMGGPESDPTGVIRTHIQQHQQQMQMKQQAAMAQQEQAQGGGGAGAPKPGATPAGPRQGKQPNGAIHPDRMAAAGAPGMPRKM